MMMRDKKMSQHTNIIFSQISHFNLTVSLQVVIYLRSLWFLRTEVKTFGIISKENQDRRGKSLITQVMFPLLCQHL